MRSLYLKCNELKVRGTQYRRKKRLHMKWWVLYMVEKNYKGAIFFFENAFFFLHHPVLICMANYFGLSQAQRQFK